MAKMEKLFEKVRERAIMPSIPSDPLNQHLPGLDLNHEIDKTTLDDADDEDALLVRNDDDSVEARLASKFQKMRLRPDENRFYGKSSNVM